MPTSMILANGLMVLRRTSYYLFSEIAITKPGYFAHRPGSGREKKATASRSVPVITLQQLAFVILTSG